MVEFRAEKQVDDELTAAAVLIEALLAEEKIADAKAAVDAEAEVVAKNQNQPVGIKFAIVAGRVTAASGDLSAAKSALETTLKKEIKMGFMAYQLETRVALAEIEIKSGQLKTGRAHLAAVAADAKAKGYNLVAHRASIVRAS